MKPFFTLIAFVCQSCTQHGPIDNSNKVKERKRAEDNKRTKELPTTWLQERDCKIRRVNNGWKDDKLEEKDTKTANKVCDSNDSLSCCSFFLCWGHCLKLVCPLDQ